MTTDNKAVCGGGEAFSFPQSQRSRMYDVLRQLGQAAIRSQKITDHDAASAAQRDCLHEIEALVSEALAARYEWADLCEPLRRSSIHSIMGGEPERYLIKIGCPDLSAMQTVRDGLVYLRENAALASTAGAGDWQPIETAPKEFQPILLHLDRGKHGDIHRAPVVGVWNHAVDAWVHWNDVGWSTDAKPTHWMPLPAAPAQSPAVPASPRSGAGEVETLETIAAWCEETFGPIEPARIAERAAEEMDELRAEPTRVEEAADVVIVLSRYPGLWAEVQRKMAVNRQRKWRLMGDGTGYHVKSAPAQSPSTSVGEG